MIKRKLYVAFILGLCAIPIFAWADYGYLTMPVAPTSLSYSNGNAGINSWVDHSFPYGQGDTSSTMTRYDGMQFFGAAAALTTCTNGVGCYNGHSGIDFAVPSGTAVLAAASGTVVQAQWENPNSTGTGFGRFVRIWHSQYGFSTLYAHLNATTTVANSPVKRGAMIGASGDTGDAASSSAYHLHFQLYDINSDITTSTGGEHLASSVDPFGWSGTSTDPWAAHDGLGYMWASARPFATSSVLNYASGTITTNTTWNADQIYVIQSSLTVASSATLTIQSGAVVKFDGTSDFLTVNGKLNVNGATANPVYFTSIKDDSVGGDTNDDATSTSPAVGGWKCISFQAGSSSTIANAVILYGGSSGLPNCTLEDAIDVVDGSVNIINTTIASTTNYGLYMASGTVSIVSSSIKNNGTYGILADTRGKLTITSSSFSNDGQDAANFDLTHGFTFTPSGNSATGSSVRAFRITGSTFANQVWAQDLPYDIASLTINSGTTLTMNPGTVVKFDANTVQVVVNGNLDVEGTSTNRVYITSLKDDSVGGDTNADTTSTNPAKGDWGIFQLNSGASATLKYAFLRYGGNFNFSTPGEIYMNGGTINGANHATFASSSVYGFEYGSGSVNAVVSSTFMNNNTDGAFNASTTTISLINNYWNASSGPTNASNAGGSGDAVTSHITFSPFLTTAP